MAEQNQKGKAGGKEKKPKKPLEYKRFEKILKQAVNAPPIKKSKIDTSTGEESG